MSSSTPEPQGDSTTPHTWSDQVIRRNEASMIQMPYFFRKTGTGRWAPTIFWMKSDSAPNGQTAHQNRPTTTNTMGISGHHSTHIRAVPGLSWAASGPRSSW